MDVFSVGIKTEQAESNWITAADIQLYQWIFSGLVMKWLIWGNCFAEEIKKLYLS